MLQKQKIIESMQKLVFKLDAEQTLQNLKREICLQITTFDVSIDAQGFFILNNKFVMAVSFCFPFKYG